MSIHWTEADVNKAFDEALNPPKNNKRPMTGLNVNALTKLLEQAKPVAPTEKPVPAGYHRMPDGSLMKNTEMK